MKETGGGENIRRSERNREKNREEERTRRPPTLPEKVDSAAIEARFCVCGRSQNSYDDVTKRYTH